MTTQNLMHFLRISKRISCNLITGSKMHFNRAFSLSSNVWKLDSNNGEKTSLYDFHIEKNGKIVNFGGYLLPVQYGDLSITASHLHTRKHASIFDVSHMLQTIVKGKDCVSCIESICTADIKNLPNNTGSLTIFTNDNGGILDDLIVTKITPDYLYIVSNAAMKKQDMNIMQNAVNKYKSNGKDVTIEFLTPSDRSLLALQGPESALALSKLISFDLNKLYFMTTIVTNICGINDCRITRCGYTGEDGFEISIPSSKTSHIVNALLDTKEQTIKMAGLGARDSLRLEAGLCLYGNDIDTNTTPIEAALSWLVSKRRRQESNYPGSNIINEQLKNGVKKRRIGIIMTDNGPPARSGTDIFINNNKVGYITSGCPSPTIKKNIAMGYIDEKYKKSDTQVLLKIREKFYSANVCKMPFIQTKYYMKPKSLS